MSLVTTDNTSPVAIDQAAILKALRLDPTKADTQALLLVCQQYHLDPLLKHMVLISGNPYVTRDGYLHVAHMSGQFDGMEVVDQGITQTEWWAKVSVYRKDMTRPFTYTGRYPKSGQLAKYGPEMAIKTAEVMALRRAFDVTGIGAADEQWDAVDVAEATIPDPATEDMRRQLQERIGDLSDGARAVLKEWWHDEMLPPLPRLSSGEIDVVDVKVSELADHDLPLSEPVVAEVVSEGAGTEQIAGSPGEPVSAPKASGEGRASRSALPSPAQPMTSQQRSMLFSLVGQAFPPPPSVGNDAKERAEFLKTMLLDGLCPALGYSGLTSRNEIDKAMAVEVIDALKSIIDDGVELAEVDGVMRLVDADGTVKP